MKKTFNIMHQMLVIGTVVMVSRFISAVLPFTLPSSVIGLVLLFILLSTNVIKLEQVDTVGNALVDNVGLFFVPAGVSAIQSIGILQQNPIGELIAIMAATIILLVATGYSTQFFLDISEAKAKIVLRGTRRVSGKLAKVEVK
jgi:holin-like protein